MLGLILTVHHDSNQCKMVWCKTPPLSFKPHGWEGDYSSGAQMNPQHLELVVNLL